MKIIRLRASDALFLAPLFLVLLLGIVVGCSSEDAPAPEAEAQTMPSGLIITQIEEGDGASPAATDKVKMHFHGTFPDGRVFDSSVQRRSPASFVLSSVTPCWTEALQMMKVGGKAKLVCPSEIAYGLRGLPPRIPPGSTLHFEVELLEIQ
ncbi:MAG: FKBP-type peptidyl-prolyl cis-trans isomerase [Myxococcota bacterium]|nr:FKBP-type peptidyl-prolyl cis-trans isomerase [Myxococcota bacterium]